MKKYLKYISPLAFLLCIFLIFEFKAIPNGKLWNNYSVLYAPVDTDDNVIVNTIRSMNISNYVCLSEQYLPINISQNSIEIAIFKLNIINDGTEYHQTRNNYFFDKSNQFRLYYIPSEYKSKLNDVVNVLNNNGIQCGVDSTASYPWILPLIGLFIVIMLCLFSKKKYVFLAGSISPLIFLYCNPFYPVALSLGLILLIVFFISNLWKRNGFISCLINSYSVPAMLFIAFLSAFSSNIKTGLLFFVELISTLSILTFVYFFEDVIRNRKSFIPVFIKPAKLINIFASKTNTIMIILISTAFILIGTYFLTSNENITSHFAKLLLPANSDFQDEKLPQLEDYYKWTWDIKTAPYRSLNQTTNSNLIEYPKYSEDSNGLIKESKVVMAYNQNFKENTYNEIEELPFNSIEKVIKSEGIHFTGGYKSSSNYHNNLFGIIMMFISLSILLFLYIFIIIRRGSKK